MTYIDLRKLTSRPDPEDAVETPEEVSGEEAEGAVEESAEEEPAGLLGAVRQGVSGWFGWWSARIGSAWTCVLHVFAVWAVVHYRNPWVTVAVTVVLVLGVCLFMPREALERAAARVEARSARRDARRGGAAEEGPEGVEEAPGDPLVAVLWHLIGEAPGVHLKTLAEYLAEAAEKGGKPAPSKAEVEAALTARGIPLQASVRDARRRVNKGVHREALMAWQQGLSHAEAAPPATGP